MHVISESLFRRASTSMTSYVSFSKIVVTYAAVAYV